MDRFSQEKYPEGNWMLNAHRSQHPGGKSEERIYQSTEGRWSNELIYYKESKKENKNSLQTISNQTTSKKVEKGSFLHFFAGGYVIFY